MNAFTAEHLAAVAEATADPQATVQDALKRMSADQGALFEPAVIDALKVIRRKSEADYLRITAHAKGFKTRLDKLTKTDRAANEDGFQELIVSTVREHAELAHNGNGDGVALIETHGHREVHLLNSKSFDNWLRGIVYSTAKIGIPAQAMQTALATLAAIGTFDGEQIETHLRSAAHGEGYYLDLCNSDMEVLRVEPDYWEIMDRAKVYFVRSAGMRALPTPSGRGDVNLLWRHVNIPEDSRLLVLTWLLDSLRPETPYPVLELTGEMGCAKSTTQRRLRALIDPHDVPLRAKAKNVEDAYIAAANTHVVSWENVSSLAPELQDALCILSTGGGFAARQLYTNSEEHVIQTKRPVIINGINAVATAPDLIERSISVELPLIPPSAKKDEKEIEPAWLKDYPTIFTGLVALFADALSLLPSVQIPAGMEKRMLDYQKLGEAVSMALGREPGEFSQRLDKMYDESVIRSLDSYGISTGIQTIADRALRKTWNGTPTALLRELNNLPEIDRSNWPKSPRSLSCQIKRLAPGLRRIGVKIENGGRTKGGTTLEISRSRSSSVV